MQTRQLGSTELRITPIGFGAWAIGGPGYEYGWGPQSDDDSVAAIHRAVDAGVNWIDTAPVYGLGRSERVIAKALKALGSSRRPYVFTKCSLVWDDSGAISHSLKAASIRYEIEDSLDRLETDVLDLCQIHWPVMPMDGRPAPDIEEGWRTLLDLQRAGKIRYIGVSNFDIPHLERITDIARPVSLQPRYSMLARKVENEILPYCLARNIGVIVYSPMAAGMLSGGMTRERALALPASDWRSGSPHFKDPHLTRNLALVEVLRRIGSRHGVSSGAVAVAWTLRHPAVTGAIVGFRRPDQVDGPLGAAMLRLSDTEILEIESCLS